MKIAIRKNVIKMRFLGSFSTILFSCEKCKTWEHVEHDRTEDWKKFWLDCCSTTQRMACENGLSWQNGINVTTNIGQGARTSVPSKNFIPFVSVCNEGAKIPLPCNAWWMLNFTFVVYRHTKSIISTRLMQLYKTRKY